MNDKPGEKRLKQALQHRNKSQNNTTTTGHILNTLQLVEAQLNTLTNYILLDLQNRIQDSFNKEELHELCYNIGLDPDNLTRQSKSEQAREIIQLAQQQRKLDELLLQLQHCRPSHFL